LDHRTAKKYALQRDGYRCPVTGLYDKTSVRSGRVQLPAGVTMGDAVFTEAAHIIAESTNYGINESERKAHQSAAVWTVLSMFSSKAEELHGELNGDQIHRLENIITLDPIIHTEFDNLSIWFTPVDVCLTPLLYRLINICYRTHSIHTKSILVMVIAE